MNLVAVIEAILFSSSEPVSVISLRRILSARESEILDAIEKLKKKYNDDENSGIELVETPSGFELRIKPSYRQFASRFAPFSDLSEGMLRTLALVILKNPILQSEIVKIQGNKAYDYIKALESKGLITTEKVKRTKLVSLSEGFEKYFGMSIEQIKQEIEKMLDKKYVESKKSQQDNEQFEDNG